MRAEKTVDLAIVKENYRKIREKVGKRVICVVKANAYGHGLYEVAKALDAEGGFAVATAEEGLEAVEAVKGKRPVLMLGRAEKDEVGKLVENGVSLTVYEKEVLLYVDKTAKRLNKRASVHIAVNTGMNRIGASERESKEIAAFAKSLNNISVDGIYSHFYDADDSRARISQLERFKRVITGENIFSHIAATSGIKYPDCILDGARVGLGLYGYGLDYVRPSMGVKCRVVAKNRLIEGDIVGYSAKFVAKRPTVCLTLSMGYADGVPRSFSGGEVIINGKKRKIIGNVCMDCCFAEGDEKVRVGDEAVFFGENGGVSSSAEDLAGFSGTISYEILCGFKRLKTRYCDKKS